MSIPKGYKFKMVRRHKLPDEIGKVYGRLTVIEFAGYARFSKKLYRCKCECGGSAVVSLNSLRRGTTRSCGCLWMEARAKPRGPRPERSLGFGVASRNLVLGNYKQRAARVGISWELTDEQACELFQGNCHYCGCPPLLVSRPRQAKRVYGEYKYNGIDGLDSSSGYEIGNVVPCCVVCNMAKRDMSCLQFYAWIEKTYSNLHAKKMIPIMQEVPIVMLWMGKNNRNRVGGKHALETIRREEIHEKSEVR